MKVNWQTKKLGELCIIELGKTPSRSEKKYWDEKKNSDNIWLSIADLLNADGKVVSDSKEYITDSGAKISKVVKEGTLLVSFKLTLGRLAFAGKDLYTNEAIAALTIRNQKELSKDYLYYYLTYFNWDSMIKGDVKIKGKTLNKAKLKIIEITFPPIIEQRRIVKTLNEVFKEVDRMKNVTKDNLLNSTYLFESYLENVFENPKKDWVHKELGDICKISSKLIDPRERDFVNLTHVGAGNIESKSGQLINLQTAKEEGLISGKFLFDRRMVLYSKIRPYLRKVVRPGFEGLCSADIYPLLPKENVLSKDFLFYLLLTSGFTKYAIQGSGRAGMPKVNREHLFAYQFSLPPLKEQNLFVKKFDLLFLETKKLEKIYLQKAASLQQLEKSVLAKAFTGGL